MFVLGIDPGLTTTGYGIVATDGATTRAVAAGAVRTSPDGATADRLAELRSDLADLIAEYDPVEAAIEEVFVSNNRRTAMSVARASGVAMATLAEAGIPVSEYTPTAVKMALCGYGNAAKDQMQKVVAMRLRLPQPPSPPDAADALAVALCHLQSMPMRRAVTEATR